MNALVVVFGSSTSKRMSDLATEIGACRLCSDRFALTHRAHQPRPVAWFQKGARILIAGQAPGARVHESGRPFTDPSGDDDVTFYDQSKLAIVPMAFCFPGYDAKGSDLPPPKICGQTWHTRVMDHLGEMPLTVLVGGYAHKYHLGIKTGVTQTVQDWRARAPHVFALPHPSWRNTGWIKKNPWFEIETLPALRARVQEVLK